ncbi:BREX-1 system adenine-specific DNA-methyltransferase PglX [Psychrobacter sp.]|uniref:BREX-1 system adenine-specific DNA-methyltransferase PglX n=1 Tax=Psychrobacter sp. TaxID=56811 RepID=UPI0028AD1AF9|nr:BREX-1 system adenine-specific DNA-methyltransferase PglX [Psychrobacter sp.]
METSNIKRYAPKARVAFMDAVAKRLNTFGISANKKGELQVIDALVQGSVLQIGDNNFDSKLAPARQRLVQKSEQLGYAQLVEQVAYTWFNRLCAIRYMEIHGYLGHGFRVLSHPNGERQFEIIDHAQDAAEELGLDRNHIIDLKLAGNKNEELYRELLLGQCHKLHEAMPFLFESLNDETELLLPDNLTRTDSILRGLVDSIPEEDWQQVEVIGWLYQFYISEKKDQVIGKVVKTEDIPAATQLFTPNWIVKYMVQNSLGAQWLSTYPESPLKAEMDYYIEPAEQSDAVNAQLKAITPSELNPEQLTLIDPASGSGHILVEAYDLFKAIYLERGYRQRDIPQLILEKNLFGLDIDQRAAQLTGFALMMKGREDDRRLFERGVKLNVMAMVDSTSLDVDTLVHGIELSQHDLNVEDLTALKDLFEHATTFGSLIQVPQNLAEKLPALKQLSETNSQDMFVKEVLEHLAPLVKQAEILAAQYDAVVANPPYMGSKYLNLKLKRHLKTNFPECVQDVYGAFILRFLASVNAGGVLSMITLPGWMALPAFDGLRDILNRSTTLCTLIDNGRGLWGPDFGSVAFALRSHKVDRYISSFRKLYSRRGEVRSSDLIEKAFFSAKSIEISTEKFISIPGSPFAYWVDDETRSLFSSHKPVSSSCIAKNGMTTGDNEVFLRYWFEVDINSVDFSLSEKRSTIGRDCKWVPYSKGGEFRKWYGNNYLLVDWEGDGERLKLNKPKTVLRNPQYYFKSAVTWSLTSMYGFGARHRDSGFAFDTNGMSLFSDYDTNVVLGFLNSSVSKYLLEIINPTIAFQAGDILKLPLPEKLTKIGDNVKKCVDISRWDWDSSEFSWNFHTCPLLGFDSGYLSLSCEAFLQQAHCKVEELVDLESAINEEVSLACFGDGRFSSRSDVSEISLFRNYGFSYGKGTSNYREKYDSVIAPELVSYSIGCMMGRYSLDEPGLIYANSGNEGFDASRYTKFPADDDGIIPLIDNEWFADDAANRLFEFISVAWDKAHLEENLDFLAANLSPKKGEGSRDTIRRYLCDKFYKDHLQTYKKRPIYWLFSSGKQKAFQCLVYLHRYNESTLSRMRTEYVTPLLGKYQAYGEQLDKQLEMAESTQDKKRLERDLKSINKKQSELREFDDKLKHYADMRISIDLDDGVKENYGKFGDLLADVKNITGKKPEVINAS